MNKIKKYKEMKFIQVECRGNQSILMDSKNSN